MDTRNQSALITDRQHVPAVGGASLTAVLAVSAVALMVEGLDPLFKVAAAAAIVGQQIYEYWDVSRHLRAGRRQDDGETAARLLRYGIGDFQGITTSAVLAAVALAGVVATVAADGALVLDPMSWGIPGVALVILALVDIAVALLRDPVNSARAALREHAAHLERPRPAVPATPQLPVAARMVKAPRYGLMLEPGEPAVDEQQLAHDPTTRTR